MTSTPDLPPPGVLRYTAFPAPIAASASAVENSHLGGNPAGVVLNAAGLTDAEMQGIASDVGYSETAFITETTASSPETGDSRRSIRYFSPDAEVPFCGHATIATAVALAERAGTGHFTFDTSIGPVVIHTSAEAGHIVAAFTSVVPQINALEPAVRQGLLALLGLVDADLDERYPLLTVYAGNWHPLIFVRDLATFDALTFDPLTARQMMDAEGWAGTISVLHAVNEREFEARNIFPVGAITEDPATGSAAASLGGYLRERGMLAPPARVQIHQGRHVNRPSLLTVDIPVSGGIVVSGTALPLVL